MTELVSALVELYSKLPFLATILQTLAAIVVAGLLSRALLRMLEAATRRLAPGPVFLVAAIVTALTYLVLLVYFAATGRSFEAGALGWLAGVAEVPLAPLGDFATPLLFGLFYPLVEAFYLLVVLLCAWGLGLFSGDPSGGAIGAVERELDTAWAERIYRLCGYHRPEAPEQRFAEWNASLVRALRYAKWISLPGALTGAIPVTLWATGAVMAEGFKRNLGRPPESPAEEKREKEQELLTAGVARDPHQLLRALALDERGPRLDLQAGGWLVGRPEHLAAQTRLAEKSRLISSLLSALGIQSFYVHQEAAAEALIAGKHVLMETPPVSGRRTFCDIMSMHEVLLRGGSVLYLSPDAEESARRARAFREVARRSNWRWAIHHHDLGTDGRTGLQLSLRQPQIVFATPESLHRDLCPSYAEWDAFFASLSLIVAIDVDRYTGARGANLSYLMRRVHRLARHAGAAPRVIATVAPFGPDVQGFAEQLLGVTMNVIGPESDSRGAPTQQIVIGQAAAFEQLHPAVAARGVALACAYNTKLWGYGPVLTEFEQEQQVNKVLLDFGKAVIGPEEATELRFDSAEALVVRLSADKAHMTSFFTCHSGRMALGVASGSAEDVGARALSQSANAATDQVPFAGFDRDQAREAEAKQAPKEKPEPESESESEQGDDEGAAPSIRVQSGHLFSLWLPDPDPFSRLLARYPAFLLPTSLHPMLALGSSLVASPDNPTLARRHLYAAAGELPLLSSEIVRDFPAGALGALDAEPQSSSRRMSRRARRVLGDDGKVTLEQELTFESALVEGAATSSVMDEVGTVLSRADGELILSTDRVRLGVVAYPGRVLVRNGRRYRVLLPDEQTRWNDGIVLAEPERRRIHTTRLRKVEFMFAGRGNEVVLGTGATVRLHHPRIVLRETVVGLRRSHGHRGTDDILRYDVPIVAEYPTQVAIVHLPVVNAEALKGLEHLVRVTLPAFLRHEEDDVDVAIIERDDGPALAIIDRHPDGIGFARALNSDIVKHVFWWSREILRACGSTDECQQNDGCTRCVFGVPSLLPDDGVRASRTATQALLDQLLGAAANEARAIRA